MVIGWATFRNKTSYSKIFRSARYRKCSLVFSEVKVIKQFSRELWLKGWWGERLPSKPSLTRKGT